MGKKTEYQKQKAALAAKKAIDMQEKANAAKEAMKTPAQKQLEAAEKVLTESVSTVEKATGIQFSPRVVAYNDEGLETFTRIWMNSFEQMLDRREAKKQPVAQSGITIEQVEELINHKLGVMMQTMTTMMDKMYQRDTEVGNTPVEFELAPFESVAVKRAEKTGKEFVGELTITNDKPTRKPHPSIGKQLKCGHCREIGHNARTCPNKVTQS